MATITEQNLRRLISLKLRKNSTCFLFESAGSSHAAETIASEIGMAGEDEAVLNTIIGYVEDEIQDSSLTDWKRPATSSAASSGARSVNLGGIAGMTLDMSHIIALIAMGEGRAAARYAYTDMPIAYAQGQLLSGLGLTGSVIIGLAVMVPLITAFEFAKLYDPYERVRSVQRISRRPVRIGEQIDYPSNTTSVDRAGIGQNPWYGILQDVLTRGLAGVQELRDEDIITADTYDWFDEKFHKAREARGIVQRAVALAQSPRLRAAAQDASPERRRRAASAVRTTWERIKRDLWDYGSNQWRQLYPEGAQQFPGGGTPGQRIVNRLRALKEITDNSDVEASVIRGAFDEQVNNDSESWGSDGFMGVIERRLRQTRGPQNGQWRHIKRAYRTYFPEE